MTRLDHKLRLAAARPEGPAVCLNHSVWVLSRSIAVHIERKQPDESFVVYINISATYARRLGDCDRDAHLADGNRNERCQCIAYKIAGDPQFVKQPKSIMPLQRKGGCLPMPKAD